jgi:hypothetical protein
MNFWRLIIGGVVLLALAGGFLWLQNRPAHAPVETPLVTFAERSAPVPLKTVFKAGTTFVCERSRCTSAPNPPDNSVTDGEWWYYYINENAESRIKNQESTKTYLRRQNAEGTIETIMESTPLTSPRGLFMSPNGQHVAFWLDNIDDPTLQLTELWVYDVNDGGIRLLAEKLYRPDVRSDVYWNSHATYLWFIADAGPQDAPNDQLELLRIRAEAPGVAIAFSDVDWDDLLKNMAAAHVDMSQQGNQLAYATTNFLGSPLLISHTPSGKHRTTLRGQVKYTQWLEDDSLLYALQDKDGFTFWRVREGVHRLITRRPGELASARSDISGEHIVFAILTSEKLQLSSLTIASGAVAEEGSIPRSAGRPEVAWVSLLSSESPPPEGAGVSALDDAELAAFIENHFSEITNDIASQPLRLIMTDEPNVLFLDYRLGNRQERRLQVKVQDAINTEWSIRARYEPLNREWKKVQGGGLADPTPTRLYEWEESLGQWVLKENLE